MKTLDHFENLIKLVKKHGLCNKFFFIAKSHIDATSKLLHTTPVQTTIFALFLEQFGEYSVSIKELADTLKCDKIQLIKYMDDIDVLQQKSLIKQAKTYNNDREYSVPLEVIDSLRKNIEYTPIRKENLKPNDFFDCIDDLFSKFFDDELSRELLISELDYLYKNNKKVCFVKMIDEYKLNTSSMLFMANLCSARASKDIDKIKMEDFSSILGNDDYRTIRRSFKSQEHELYKNGLVQYDFYKGMIDTENCLLTKKAKNEFLADVTLDETSNKKGKSYILTENISTKKLFYNQENEKQIHELTNLLMEDNFSNIQKRLNENGMRTGFACIFSGSPGTGKTETVYQIAKKTGRDIVMVNISETKSCWFGESEKLIKEVFDQYRALVKKDGVIPILLFNEADAVLGKRKEIVNSDSGVAQTENAIQNIILQEMEDLNGILIATTNMTSNLDKAFERRFLYKIEFSKPDIEAKKLIWQSLIPSLTDTDANVLAKQYNYSGGQIENIARKCTIETILKGTVPDLNTLQIFCKEETIEKQAIKIGFV